MAENDSINAPINVGITAQGTPSVQQASAALRGMGAELGLIKTQLKEAGVSGSSFAKMTGDSKELFYQSTAALKNYNAQVEKYGADSRQALSALKNLNSAFTALRTEIQQLDTAQNELNTGGNALTDSVQGKFLGSLKSWALGFVSVYAAINLIKGAFSAASDFDKQLDTLAVSSGKTGDAFTKASQGLHDLARSTSEGTIFSEDKVLDAMTKFRDRGFDVFSMTKSQLQPVIQAATATMQDLGDVADATAVTMNQFGLTISDTGHIANLLAESFKLAGTSAEGFRDQITAAGAVAKESGVSLESYLAVTTRLKQLGFSDAQAGQFQKLFFAATQAPSAKQLQALHSAALNVYATPESFDAQAKAQTTGLNGLMNFGRKLTGQATPELDHVRVLQAEAAETQKKQAELVALADQQDKVNVQLFVYDKYIAQTKEHIDSLKETQSAWKDKLADTKEQLSSVKEQLAQIADPQISGMHEFDAAIVASSIAAKKYQLETLQNKESTRAYERTIQDLNDAMKVQEHGLERLQKHYADVGKELEAAKNKGSELDQQLQKLHSTELAGEKGFTDEQFGIQQKINALALKKTTAGLFEGNQIDKQVAALQKKLEQSRLKEGLTFDPQKKAIDEAANAADIATGKKSGPLGAADIIQQIKDTTAAYIAQKSKIDELTAEHDQEGEAIERKQKKIDKLKTRIDTVSDAMEKVKRATQDAQDQLQRLNDVAEKLKLEKEVEFGQQVFDIKERLRAAREEMGLVAKEQPFEDIMASIPVLAGQYKDLMGQQDFEKKTIDDYDRQIAVSGGEVKGYERKLADLQTQSTELKDATKKLEEEFGNMTKPLVDEATLLDNLKTSGLGVGAMYDLLGKRGGAALAAILGDKGQNLGILEKLRDTLYTASDATNNAGDVNKSLYGSMEKVAAKLKDLEIDVGTNLAGSLTGLMGAIVSLTDAILHSAFLHPIDTLNSGLQAGDQAITSWEESHLGIPDPHGGAKLTPEAQKSLHDRHIPGYANGGVVPGYGTGDSVLAMLAPKERVLTPEQNAAYESGASGSVSIHFHGPVAVRSDQDIQTIASMVSKEIRKEYQRARAGMPA